MPDGGINKMRIAISVFCFLGCLTNFIISVVRGYSSATVAIQAFCTMLTFALMLIRFLEV